MYLFFLKMRGCSWTEEMSEHQRISHVQWSRKSSQPADRDALSQKP